MERMTGFDASLLYLETDQQPLVVGGLLVITIADLEVEYSFERLRTELGRRIKELPELRRKIYDSPLNLGHPAWVEEYHLDITAHVRRVDVALPGDDRAVFDMCGTLGSRPLDRSRPLWEMWVLERLSEEDTIAVYFRAHHAILDGANGASILHKLSTAGQDPAARDPDLVRVEAGGANPIRLLAGGWWDFSVRRPLTLARLLPEIAALPFALRKGSPPKKPDAPTTKGEGSPPKKPDAPTTTTTAAKPHGSTANRADTTDRAGTSDPTGTANGSAASPANATGPAEEADVVVVPRAAPFIAPRTRFNTTITPHRAVWGTSLDLDEITQITEAFGVTVNDVYLAVVGGGLRRYLRSHDDLPAKPLIAVVPVSTRDDNSTTGNNRVTVLFASLGTDIADPLDRLRAISARTRRGKKQTKSAMRPDLIQDVATLAPARTLQLLMRIYGDFRLADLHPVVHNLVVSNIPGPKEELDFLGGRVTHMYPLGPLMHGSGLSITAMSVNGQLDVGINGCEHLVPDPDVLATGIRESMARLLELTRAAGRPPSAG